MMNSSPKKQPENGKKVKTVNPEIAPEINEEKPLAATYSNELKQVARWEKQWVAIQNVIEFGPEIWVKKWVLVRDGAEVRKRSRSHSQYSEFSAHESIDEKTQKKTKRDLWKKHVCQFENCGKVFFDGGKPIYLQILQAP